MLILVVIGYFYNLGLIPLHADEAIRGTVAHEMMVNGNYIVPKISDEFYYRKPPLYNWLLVATFDITDSFSEFVIRLPSVIPLFLFAITIWLFSRKYFGNRVGILAGFLFILMGSLISRDSMLGHIDIFYSWITFLGFCSIFHFYEKKKYWSLFLISYLLAATGVLLKGLPSFLFQGLTLLAWFIYKKEFKKLLSVQHFVGISLFAIIIGSYFFAYSKYNSVVPFLEALYSQSSQRTMLEKEWYEGLLNIFLFPLENLFLHMMPSALIFIFLFKKGVFKDWFNNDLVSFLTITLAINIVPYWLSPGYYPRYLYMLYPLLFIIGALKYYQNRNGSKTQRKIFETIFLALGITLSISFLASMFIPELNKIEHRQLKGLGLFLMCSIIVFQYIKQKELRIYWALCFVALFRIGFDAFVLPYRANISPNSTTVQKAHAERILAIAQDSELYLYKNTPMKYEYNYYLGTERDETIKKRNDAAKDVMYITHEGLLDDMDYDLLYKFSQDYSEKPELWLVKFNKDH